MRDETLKEPSAVPEIFVDGFDDHRIHNGVMTCAGYRLDFHGEQEDGPRRVVVLRLVWPASSTEEAIADARQAVSAPMLVRLMLTPEDTPN